VAFPQQPGGAVRGAGRAGGKSGGRPGMPEVWLGEGSRAAGGGDWRLGGDGRGGLWEGNEGFGRWVGQRVWC